MKNREILTMVLLMVFTLGIYGIVWSYKFQDELHEKTGEGFSGIGHLLMMFVTFGIYGLYWQYAAGLRLAKQGQEDKAILYLILSVIGFGFLNPFFMQQQANAIT